MSKGTYSVNSKIKSRINTIRTPFSKFWIEIIPTSSQAKWLSIFVWRVFELVTTLLHTNFCLPVRNIETFLFNHLAGQNVGKKIVRKIAYKLKSSHVIKFHIKIFEAIFTGQLLRPRNETRCFFSASTVFTSLIGRRLQWRSNAVFESIR